ncbi:MAG: bifunctional phosphoribosylaminoimidazolecarboxamide formyltransferase/IMP cyclohydrolase [Candidatus Aenigmarchaeota archaeon]|nr:bifunctional phosphoribosylaminoimidazolecarboxamide formyltransferase/IMP cyclohydrolase [Candidatus Aenigmarchaeota archaeon]
MATALLSVADKDGIDRLAAGLARLGIALIATAGTQRRLAAKGITATAIETVTGFSDLLGGRVKTLHPKVMAGILADRDDKQHLQQLAEIGAVPIDIVVANLYPFETAVAGGKPEADIIENIDIGGVSLVRAAAKNYRHVAVLINSRQYDAFLAEAKKGSSLATRKRLAAEAFAYIAHYDALIAAHFRTEALPHYLGLALRKEADCRYGENPHQQAAVYGLLPGIRPALVAGQLHGKAMSYNNFADSDTALAIVSGFVPAAAAIVKHENVCGFALGQDISQAFRRALDCDKLSAFGGIIALNRECDSGTARQITAFYNEVVIAPSFAAEALAALKKKSNLRIIQAGRQDRHGYSLHTIADGMLVQESDQLKIDISKAEKVSKAQPNAAHLADLEVAWQVARMLKSNGIAIVKGQATVGIGAGQPSRIGSVQIACTHAGAKANGAVLASDGFFPFRDSIDLAAKHGIKAIIHPGGSLKDKEVVQAADEHGIAMLTTGTRAFRH